MQIYFDDGTHTCNFDFFSKMVVNHYYNDKTETYEYVLSINDINDNAYCKIMQYAMNKFGIDDSKKVDCIIKYVDNTPYLYINNYRCTIDISKEEIEHLKQRREFFSE